MNRKGRRERRGRRGGWGIDFKGNERGLTRWEVVSVLLGMGILTLAVVVSVARLIRQAKPIASEMAAENNEIKKPQSNFYKPLVNEKVSLFDGGEFQDAIARRISRFFLKVDSNAYSDVRRFLSKGKLPPKEVVKIEELVNYFGYDYGQPAGDRLLSAVTEVAEAPWNSTHLLVRIGLQAKRIQKEIFPPSNFVFLIDVSGSMAEPNKLPLLKQALRSLVSQLTEKDRVTIVVYPRKKGLFLPTTPGNQKDRILGAIERLQAGDNSAGGAGIRLACEIAKKNFTSQGNNRIIWVTDGDFKAGTSGEKERDRFIDEYRNRKIFISLLGMGMKELKNSQMEEIAERAKGNYAYLEKLEDAEIALANERTGTPYPLARNLKITVEFNYKKVIAYRLIGYDRERQWQAQLYKKQPRPSQSPSISYDGSEGEDVGAGESVTAFYELIPVGAAIDVNVPNLEPEKSHIEPDETSFYRPNELLRLKVEYQPIGGKESELIEQPVLDAGLTLEKASADFKFSAGVAEFGLILRGDENRGNANFEEVLKLATQSKGADLDGKRAEFVDLVKRSQRLAESQP